jgi:hypothetical protein
MLKFLKWTVIVVAVVALCGGAFVFYQIRSLDAERITDDLHLIKGLGGNVAVLKTGAGMRQLAAVGADAKAQGRSLHDTQRNAKLTEGAGYQSIEVPLILALNRPFVIRRAWEEANGVKATR